jgi:hypothetical protein
MRALFLSLPLVVLLFKGTAASASSSNVIAIEGLGKSFLANIQYERRFENQFFFGVGIGITGLKHRDGSDSESYAALFPFYLGYYILSQPATPLVTAGFSLVYHWTWDPVTNPGGFQFSKNYVNPFLGVGYEYRLESGFLGRTSGYVEFGDNVKPWFGLTLGYAF